MYIVYTYLWDTSWLNIKLAGQLPDLESQMEKCFFWENKVDKCMTYASHWTKTKPRQIIL